jgi:CheY-like chemotaxis protein
VAVLAGTSILLVEDDLDNLELMQLSLQRLGAHVVAAQDAREAVASCKAALPDVLVCDLKLDGEDGCKLLEQLRTASRPSGLPAIALTGRADEKTRLEASNAGFQRYLIKPTNVSELAGAIVSLLASSPSS